MANLTDLYRINATNLELRKSLMRFTERDIATLRSLAPWAARVAPTIAREFYEHQFTHAGTGAFFRDYAARKNIPIEKLRVHLETAQAGYFRQIFDEAVQGGEFGTAYFERRLKVGQLHNHIDLPLKWYVGSYAVYQDLVRKYLGRSLMLQPGARARAERAIFTIFNFDIQAIMDAFFFDYLATAGVDLEQVHVARKEHDLSEQGAEMKGILVDTLTEAARTSRIVAEVSSQLGETTSQVSRAVQQVTIAMQNVASGAVESSQTVQEGSAAVNQLSDAIDSSARRAAEQGGQARAIAGTAQDMADSVGQVTEKAQLVAASSQKTKVAAHDGSEAVRETVRRMQEIKAVVGQAALRVEDLGRLGEKIGAVIETIDDVAEQTNLLALNAAIEAARAGEHGRGFAVVADEVRKLADRSQRETKAIAALVHDVQVGTREAVAAISLGSARVEDGSVMADRAGAALDVIIAAVEATDDQVSGIAASASALESGARRTAEGMGAMRESIDLSSSTTDEMASQAALLTATVESMAAVSEENSASTEEVSAAAQEMMAQVEEIAARVHDLTRIALDLEKVISRLKLDAPVAEGAPRQTGQPTPVKLSAVRQRAAR